MPDKSCRTCGGELLKWSICSDCKKVIQKICKGCSEKTVKEVHNHHIHLEPYIITKQILDTVQSFAEHNPKKKDKKHTKTVAISIMVAGIIVLGISLTNYVEFSTAFTQNDAKPSIPDKATSTPIQDKIIQQDQPTQNIQTIQQEPAYTYNNCLGVSDGIHLTVTCPTEYGVPYKAVVKIPIELIVQLESNIFNLRQISVIEHTDSISIQYAKKTYEARFINS